MSRSRDGGRCFMPHEYRNRRPAENLTRVGQENGKSSQLPGPGMVTWGPGRDPAKPAAPCQTGETNAWKDLTHQFATG